MELQRECSKCKVVKNLEENFWRDSSRVHGRGYICITCKKEEQKTRIKNNPYREREKRKRYYRTGIEKDKSWAVNSKPGKRDRYKINAAARVYRFVQEGKISKPDTCELCNRQFPSKEIHGHHEDYNKPLGVNWLCRDCHVDVHMGLRQLA